MVCHTMPKAIKSYYLQIDQAGSTYWMFLSSNLMEEISPKSKCQKLLISMKKLQRQKRF